MQIAFQSLNTGVEHSFRTTGIFVTRYKSKMPNAAYISPFNTKTGVVGYSSIQKSPISSSLVTPPSEKSK